MFHLIGIGWFRVDHLLMHVQKATGLEQYAIKKFAEALEVIPRTLAENAGLDAREVIAKLYASHQEGNARIGVDIEVLYPCRDSALFCLTW